MSKTGATGVLLTEAKYINLSLHCLEQVSIRSVQEMAQEYTIYYALIDICDSFFYNVVLPFTMHVSVLCYVIVYLSVW